MRAFIYISGIQILMVFTGLSTGTQKCHGNPRSYNNKRCASTTWYHDGRQGACGCGYDGADMQFDWSKSKYTAAANQLYFDNHKQWCGQTCGTCVNLTTTGGSAPGGENTKEGQSHVFMIVDLCPNESPNLEWCSQTVSHPTNQYGYDAHFDLENGVTQITNGLNWDNVEVTYETVDCSQAHTAEHMTPSNRGSAPGGVNTKEGQSHLFMIVDLCPNEAPNREWCSQTVNHPTNQYGYDAHFDLENGVQQITNGLNWDNVEVTYETVDCSQAHPAEHMTPSNSNYHQCECYKLQHGNR